jgi:DNA-binding transcriptional ArsR family regulator
MNDDGTVSRWQDGRVPRNDTAASATDPVRVVDDAATLKALADPLRIEILRTLMHPPGPRRVMSVKELAEDLGEPQTKLYRHIRQLEAAGLIRVAASRLVSGILEQRYQACQTSLEFGPGALGSRAEVTAGTAADAATVLRAILGQYGERFLAAAASQPPPPDDLPEAESYRQPLLAVQEKSVPPGVAARIRDRLQAVHDELSAAASAADGADGGVPGDWVEVSVLTGFISPPPTPES